MGQKKKKEEKRGRKEEGSPEEGAFSLPWKFLVVVLTLGFGVTHRNHVATMFERDRHFSHLSNLEREMTFRTEMGLYYSYYKTLVNAETVWEGMEELTQDSVSEHGHTINTLKRFNLYPELLFGVLYRGYMSVAKELKWKTKECWQTNRGEGLDPIISCEGMGDQFYFYINLTFALAGTVTSTLFLFGVLLSGSVLGGLVVMAGFFFNHGEATRVQWTPPLRESFGYPVWAAQMLIVTYILKYNKSGFGWSALVGFLTTSFMLPWQFASFAISTQVCSLFGAFVLEYIPLKTMKTILVGHVLGFVGGYVLLFGNEMLLSSLFLASLLSCMTLVYLGGPLRNVTLRPLYVLLYVALFFAGVVNVKYLVSLAIPIRDDAHIFEILASKFSNFKNFHTSLYTCAVEFDFLEYATYWKLSKTLLLPTVIIAVLALAVSVLKLEWPLVVWRPKYPSGHHHYHHPQGVHPHPDALPKPYPAEMYNLIQLVAYTIMAVLIMRLKLFWSPHLCIMASLVASKPVMTRCFGDILSGGRQEAGVVVLMALMAVEGVGNIRHQWSIMGEYSNMPQEELFHWINKETPQTAVFAGPMPTMANVKLSTGRPITNHPHYEDAELRERTMKVYSIFSKKPTREVHEILRGMGVNFVIFESGWCHRGPNMPEIWDLVEPENAGGAPLCEVLKTRNIAPFSLAYENKQYRVLKVQ